MDLTKYQLGGRQIFGFFAPGLVWLFNISTVVYYFEGIHIGQLDYTYFLFISIVVSYILGFSMESVSFYLSVNISSFMRGERLSSGKYDYTYMPRHIPEEIFKESKKLVNNDLGDEVLSTMSENDIMEYCKHYIIEHSSYYGTKARERETHVNILSMFPLPILTLSLIIITIGSSVFDISLLLKYFFVIICILVSFLMIFRLHPLRVNEAKYIFIYFLSVKNKQY
jgi:hypothetical protein